MDYNNFPLNKTTVLSSITEDYIYTDKLNEFIQNKANLDGLSKSIDERKITFDRKILVAELNSQNTSKSELVKANIDLLVQDNTYTVTTGHQICLFTGPLYSIYKIVSTIKLCKQLKEKHPDKNFVPIFWMATEDHDKEEINHLHVFNNQLVWNTPQTGMVGNFNLNGIETVLSSLKDIFSNNADLINPIIEIYETAPTLKVAHRNLINYLFESHGLVIIDGDSKTFKQGISKAFENELLESKTSEIIEQQSNKLADLGYKNQVTPREINLFYLGDDFRERIVFENNHYHVLNTSLKFTKDGILNELKENPEKFSPNVALRPIYQEFLLPNIATIGGPGEIAYWLQLKNAFLYHQVNFPVLILRDSFLIFRKSILKKMESNLLTLGDLFKNPDLVVKEKIVESSEISFDQEIKELEKIFDIAKEKAVNIDTSLEKTVIGELKKAQNSINMIRSKTIKAEKKNNEITVNQINSVYEYAFPNGVFQERYDNFLNFYNQDFLNSLLEIANPLDNSLKIKQ